MKSNSSSNALVGVGIIVFIIGSIVGRRPLMLNDELSCGSGLVPGSCVPGLHNSSMTISIVLLLIGAAAPIAGTVVRSQKPPAGKKQAAGKKKSAGKRKSGTTAPDRQLN